MKQVKSHFKFNKQERSGIFFLLVLLVLVQFGYFFFTVRGSASSAALVLDEDTQQEINLLKQKALSADSVALYPFNPNFISDYKGYTLGLSVDEIDRLHVYRNKGKFVNTVAEFQKVTQVSDSVLNKISPYFKFPEWVSAKAKSSSERSDRFGTKQKKAAIVLIDLNMATEEQLKGVYGIGDKLAARIIKFRDRLGGFLLDEQLSDVYGLKPEVVERVLKRFRVMKIPIIEKLDINSATAEELAQLVYINQSLAYNIVAFRDDNGGIRSFDELLEIETFPVDRINRIALYLFLKK